MLISGAGPTEAFIWYGRNRHNNMLDIDANMIDAINGPVNSTPSYR